MVDEVDNVVQSAACALTHVGSSDGDGEMGFAGSTAADQYDVAFGLHEAATGELSARAAENVTLASSSPLTCLHVGGISYINDTCWSPATRTMRLQPNIFALRSTTTAARDRSPVLFDGTAYKLSTPAKLGLIGHLGSRHRG